MNNFTTHSTHSTHSTNPSTRLTFCSPTPYVKVCYNINSNIPDTYKTYIESEKVIMNFLKYFLLHKVGMIG
jgi:hypothetical protein